MIMGNPDSATTQAILESYFSPVMSFRQSTSRLMASLATADLGVSTEIGRLQFFLITLMAFFILSTSFSRGILFSR